MRSGQSRFRQQKSIGSVKSEFEFNSQEEIDEFYMSKWGYKSNMGGFAEERLAGLLKQQYQLEYELEKAKQDLIL